VVATTGAVIYVLSSFTLGRDVSTMVLLAGVGAGIVAVLAIAVYGQYYARISAGHDPLDLLPGIFGAGTIAVLIFLAVTGRLSAVTSIDLPGWGRSRTTVSERPVIACPATRWPWRRRPVSTHRSPDRSGSTRSVRDRTHRPRAEPPRSTTDR